MLHGDEPQGYLGNYLIPRNLPERPHLLSRVRSHGAVIKSDSRSLAT